MVDARGRGTGPVPAPVRSVHFAVEPPTGEAVVDGAGLQRGYWHHTSDV